MNYWLFTVMYDAFPPLWPKLVKCGLAAQHYSHGWRNETRNINALQQMKRGDGVIASLKGHRFAGYGFLKSDFYRGGPTLAIKHEDGTLLEFRERAEIDWMAIDPASNVPYIDARHLKDKGFEVDLTHGLCVKRINRRTFEKFASFWTRKVRRFRQPCRRCKHTNPLSGSASAIPSDIWLN